MKKFIATFLTILIAISSFTTIGVFAEKPITVMLNGSLVEFDVPPQIIDDRTMVPIRKICEALGMKVDFEDSTRKITITDSTGFKIINILGNKNFELIDNGISKMVESDVPTLTVNDRTMIPARFLSELVNMYVKWDGANSQVIITSDFPANGNTNGNFSANYGQFAFDEEYIYYCDGYDLYKVKKDGTKKSKLDSGYVTSINIVEDWLYYVSNDKVIKIKKDGTQRTTLSWIDIAQDRMVISNNVMYYADTWGGLFRVNLDGTNTTRMGDIFTIDFQVDGDWIYYGPMTRPYEYIGRINTDGTKQEIILDSSCDNFVVSNGWIYYTNTSRDGEKGLFKIRCNGSGKQLLKNSTEIWELNYCNGWIYFKEENNDNFNLIRIDRDGNNEKLIKEFDGPTWGLDIGISNNLIATVGRNENETELLNTYITTYNLTDVGNVSTLLTVTSDEYKKAESTTPSEKFDETTTQWFTDGMYRIGIDIPAGDYYAVATGKYSGYYCKYTDSTQDDIEDNAMFDTFTFFRCYKGQYLKLSDCKITDIKNAPVYNAKNGVYEDGMYRVGIDIPAGNYTFTPKSGKNSGYYCAYTDITYQDIDENNLFNSTSYYTIKKGQYLEISDAIATKTTDGVGAVDIEHPDAFETFKNHIIKKGTQTNGEYSIELNLNKIYNLNGFVSFICSYSDKYKTITIQSITSSSDYTMTNTHRFEFKKIGGEYASSCIYLVNGRKAYFIDGFENPSAVKKNYNANVTSFDVANEMGEYITDTISNDEINELGRALAEGSIMTVTALQAYLLNNSFLGLDISDFGFTNF